LAVPPVETYVGTVDADEEATVPMVDGTLVVDDWSGTDEDVLWLVRVIMGEVADTTGFVVEVDMLSTTEEILEVWVVDLVVEIDDATLAVEVGATVPAVFS